MNLLNQQKYFREEVVPAALDIIRWWTEGGINFIETSDGTILQSIDAITWSLKMGRISRDKMLMDIALVVKQRSTCLRRQVGAVLALDGRIISTGYNGTPRGVPHCTPNVCNAEKPCVDTIHAEANTVAFAAQNAISTYGTVLYTTASPCRECAKLLINAGVVEVVYSEEYRDTSPITLLTGVGIRVRRFNSLPATTDLPEV